MIGDLDAGGIAALTSIESHRDKLHDYYPELRTVYETAVAWPILWLLVRYSPKHIFQPRDMPSADKLRDDLYSFCNKLKWKYKYRRDKWEIPFKLKRPDFTPSCDNKAEAPLEQWIGKFQSHIFDAYRLARRKARGFQGNMPRLAKYAMTLMRRQELKAIPNDKGGGFSVLPASKMEIVEQQILANPMYEMLEDDQFVALKKTSRREAMQFISLIGKVEPKLAEYIKRPLNRGSITATLNVKVKSAKPAGEVVCRALHSIPVFSFEGIAKWTSQVIRRILDTECSWLVRNSTEAAQKLRALRVDESDVFAKLDMKDFYHSGTPKQLEDDVLQLLPETHAAKPALRKALRLLLQHQYIKARTQTPAYRVVSGSGMGLSHSGDIADGAYYQHVEKWLCTKKTMEEHAVKIYLRFKDDCILVAPRKYMLKLIHELKDRSGYFKIVCESIHSLTAKFLELRLNRCGHEIQVKYEFKENLIPQPLSAHSAQSLYVHVGWPAMVIRNIRRISNTETEAEEIICELKRRYSSPMVPILWPTPRIKNKKEKKDRSSTAWFAVRMHPALQATIPKAVQKFLEQHPKLTERAFRYFKKPTSTVAVAWKNSYRKLEYSLR